MIGADAISALSLAPTSPAAKSGAKVQGANDARTQSMAKEFEAVFLSMLLKQMRESLEPDQGLFPGDSGDVQGGLFDLYMSRHLADSGGVGLADALIRQIASANTNTKPSATADDRRSNFERIANAMRTPAR